jgi:branched-chain amino acid transport system substrate-binding protein
LTNKKPIWAAALAAAGLVLSACGTTGGESAQPEAGASKACNLEFAFMGPLTGDYANLGINAVNGAKLALDEYNKQNADCQVVLREFDSQGDPEKATPLASEIVNDQKILGLVGPMFSGETNATGEIFNEAKLVTVTPSATNPDLSKNGWDTFHRLLGTDEPQGAAAARYIKDTLAAKKAFVVDDASEYGKFLAGKVEKDLGDLVAGTDTIQQKQTDFGPTVTKVKASGADALWFGGYYAEAGLLAKQLKAGGWKGTFLSGDGVLDPGFIEGAGASAANGSILTCPCAPADASFTEKYKAISGGSDPATYSTEGYDSMNVFLQAVAAGKATRPDMLDWVNNYDAKGITKQIKFDQSGELSEVTIYAYKVEGGKIIPGTPISGA